MIDEEEEIPPEEAPIKLPIPEGRAALITDEVITEKVLTFEEASRCLNTLGKDESGVRYAYLMMSAVDQKLTNIAVILNFKHLLFVDVSGNYLNLEGLQVLSQMPYVVYIKAHRNRVESAALNTLPYLQVLSLSRNVITETCDINQPMLQCLDLNYNQIYTAQFDKERLEAIKQIELRGNQMFDLSGTFPDGLECLYLAANRIAKFVENDMAKLVNLKILHLRNNQIRKLDGFSSLMVNLNYLNLRQNKITKIRQFRKLKCLPALDTLVYSDNPVAGEPKAAGEEDEDEDAEAEEDKADDPTRVAVLILLPNLKRINKLPVTLEEKEEAFETKDEKYEEIMNEDSSEDETEAPTTTDYTTDYTTELDTEG